MRGGDGGTTRILTIGDGSKWNQGYHVYNVCVYIRIHEYTHARARTGHMYDACVYICTHKLTQTLINTHTHAYTRTHTGHIFNICVYVCTHKHTHTHTHTGHIYDMCVYISTLKHTQTHTHAGRIYNIRAYIYTHINKRTHKRTQVVMSASAASRSFSDAPVPELSYPTESSYPTSCGEEGFNWLSRAVAPTLGVTPLTAIGSCVDKSASSWDSRNPAMCSTRRRFSPHDALPQLDGGNAEVEDDDICDASVTPASPAINCDESIECLSTPCIDSPLLSELQVLGGETVPGAQAECTVSEEDRISGVPQLDDSYTDNENAHHMMGTAKCSNGCAGDDAMATQWCSECSAALCSFCVEEHARQRTTRWHLLLHHIPVATLSVSLSTQQVAQSFRKLPQDVQEEHLGSHAHTCSEGAAGRFAGTRDQGVNRCSEKLGNVSALERNAQSPCDDESPCEGNAYCNTATRTAAITATRPSHIEECDLTNRIELDMKNIADRSSNEVFSERSSNGLAGDAVLAPDETSTFRVLADEDGTCRVLPVAADRHGHAHHDDAGEYLGDNHVAVSMKQSDLEMPHDSVLPTHSSTLPCTISVSKVRVETEVTMPNIVTESQPSSHVMGNIPGVFKYSVGEAVEILWHYNRQATKKNIWHVGVVNTVHDKGNGVITYDVKISDTITKNPRVIIMRDIISSEIRPRREHGEKPHIPSKEHCNLSHASAATNAKRKKFENVTLQDYTVQMQNKKGPGCVCVQACVCKQAKGTGQHRARTARGIRAHNHVERRAKSASNLKMIVEKAKKRYERGGQKHDELIISGRD